MPISMAAIAHGKHVMCEKPLAMNYPDAKAMADAADAANVRHMTAFTYRFVPSMRYLAHLIKSGSLGQPYHFRSCRLQDWGARDLGWRQIKKLAGVGELGDMLSHRIDFSQNLVGPMKRLVAQTKILVHDRQGSPSDLEDWVAIISEFENGATGVLESSNSQPANGTNCNMARPGDRVSRCCLCQRNSGKCRAARAIRARAIRSSPFGTIKPLNLSKRSATSGPARRAFTTVRARRR
jgi:predicted dehydrogenase